MMINCLQSIQSTFIDSEDYIFGELDVAYSLKMFHLKSEVKCMLEIITMFGKSQPSAKDMPEEGCKWTGFDFQSIMKLG